MSHSLDIAIRSTHAISRIRGEDFPTPDSLYCPSDLVSVGPNADASAVVAFARRPGRPARDGVERTPLVAVVDGFEALVSVGVPDRPTLAKVRVDGVG